MCLFHGIIFLIGQGRSPATRKPVIQSCRWLGRFSGNSGQKESIGLKNEVALYTGSVLGTGILIRIAGRRETRSSDYELYASSG